MGHAVRMKSRKFHILKIGAWALAGFVVAVVGVITIWRLSLISQNKARLKAIAARGEPVDSLALNQSYQHVPDSENAALMWLGAASEMTAEAVDYRSWNKFKLPDRGAAAPEAQIVFARGILASNQTALATCRRASGLPRTRYPIDLTLGMNTLLPHLSRINRLSKLLRAEAFLAVENQEPGRAVDAIETLLALGRSLSLEPAVASQNVSRDADTLAFRTTEYAINRLRLTGQQLQRLIAAFARSEDTNSLYRSLLGERAAFVTAAKDPQGTIGAMGGPGITPSPFEEALQSSVWRIIQWTGFFERDFAFGVDALTTNVARAQLPDPQRFASRTNWPVIEARAQNGFYLLSRMFLPPQVRLIERDTEHRAHARVAQTALAIERYRLSHDGASPENLNALIPAFLPAVPVDPFDGQPLRFQRRHSGYVVYSIGIDAKDDGGAERPAKPKEQDRWDVTFIVERK
jgi:hypothetical protein